MAVVHFGEAEEHHADIVIVGAGVAGLYCALRLLENEDAAEPSRTARITIVERLNRTGGRLNTDIIEVEGGQRVREEEGGMRFNYDMHELMRLINSLDLCDEITPFPMASNVPDLGNTNRFLLRGRRFTAVEAAQGGNTIWSEIYDLDDAEKGLSPTDIVTNAYRAVLHQNGRSAPQTTTPDFWTDFRENVSWNGVSINQWQMWGLLRDMGHSQECIEMLSATIGFAGPFKAPINAGDAFQILADFPKDPSYSTFERGFSTLPDAVAAKLVGRVQIVLSTNVDSIAREGSEFELVLTEAPAEQDSNPYIPGGVTKRITAGAVILAVATSGMERLFTTSPALNSHPDAHRLWDSIHAAMGMPLMKINLYFEAPWWANGTIDPPIQFGPNFTDLPINAVYPFYSLPDTEQSALGGGPPLDEAGALTVYCDFENANFWAGLQNVGAPFTSALQAVQDAKVPQTLFAASEQVVFEAKNQLAALFGVEVPDPMLTSFRLWDGSNDFEYAYHQWRLGVIDSEVRTFLAAPMDGVHFCNEAISDMQGWVNGSLRSADLVLAHFGIGPMTSAACTQPDSAQTGAPQQVRATGLWGG